MEKNRPETRKRAQLGIVEAVTLHCPDCKELCVNDAGSQLIGPCDDVVHCETCNKSLSIPADAIILFKRNK